MDFYSTEPTYGFHLYLESNLYKKLCILSIDPLEFPAHYRDILFTRGQLYISWYVLHCSNCPSPIVNISSLHSCMHDYIVPGICQNHISTPNNHSIVLFTSVLLITFLHCFMLWGSVMASYSKVIEYCVPPTNKRIL